MKNICIRRHKMTIKRTTSITQIAVLLILAVSIAFPAYAGWQVQGRKLSWVMTAPDGWIGGNYYQIENVERTIQSKDMRMILNEMKREAKVLEAYLINMDVKGARTHTVTSILVNVIGVGSGVNVSELWTNLASNIERDHPVGSRTRIANTYAVITGGYKAEEAVYKTTLPNGDVVYEVVHLVMLGTNQGHLFTLKVDGAHFDKRYREFVQMLKSLQYR